MTFVVDASVAACWRYHDEEDERADAAYELLETERALVPLHWWFEVGNVLILSERRRRLSAQHTTTFVERLERFPIDFARFPERANVLDLARHHRLTFHDAAYLELAQGEGLVLATLDDDLAAAARAEGVPLIAAS